MAVALSRHFEVVDAIDFSEKQITNAQQISNVNYSIATAESTGKPSRHYDLITVGQAAHWFQLKEFYAEVKRIIVPDGTLALFGYQLPTVDSAVDEVLLEFYDNLLGEYWDPERILVDQAYEKLFYPFEKIPAPHFQSKYEWTMDQFTGFLSTWSAVQHYINRNQSDPLALYLSKFQKAWGADPVKKISFPVFLLLSRI